MQRRSAMAFFLLLCAAMILAGCSTEAGPYADNGTTADLLGFASDFLHQLLAAWLL